MDQTANIQKSTTEKEAREQLKLQLAHHLEQQPESVLLLHKWMKRLEAVGVGIILGAFLLALYISITWKSVDPRMIAVAWFAFAASVAPALIFLGLDAISLRAFPPVMWIGKPPKFVTGSGAVWAGAGFILLALVAAAFWGLFAYATWTQNWVILKPLISLLGILMGFGMALSILVGMVRTTVRKITKPH